MATVNIPRDITDQFYRYKMPVLQAKVEGRGNGIKTVIVNMPEIAKSLDRPPSYTTKFFGFELGALTTIGDDKHIVNGKHDQETLAKALDNFIERFVLCKKCGRNPETKMILKGDNIILHCIACGNRSDVDMRHKLASYIVKNPGEINGGGDDGASKKSRRKGKKNKKDKEESSDEDPGFEEETAPKPKPKKEEEEVVWYTDTSKEAAEHRRRNMLDDTSELAAKLLSANIDKKEEEQGDPIEKLNEFAKTKPLTELAAEIKRVVAKEEWTEEQVAQVVFYILFDATVLKQMKDEGKLALLKQFVSDEKAQPGLLAGVVKLCGGDEALRKSAPHILKTLYDEDMLSEEVLIAWHTKRSKGDTKLVKEASTVFIDWLKNAEEESDDDEDSD